MDTGAEFFYKSNLALSLTGSSSLSYLFINSCHVQLNNRLQFKNE